MNDRVQWHRGEEAAEAQALDQEVDLDLPAQDLDDIFEEREDIRNVAKHG